VLLADEVRLARVQAYTPGYERELPVTRAPFRIGLGGQATLFHAPPMTMTSLIDVHQRHSVAGRRQHTRQALFAGAPPMTSRTHQYD
jgi:hypothetical protein